MSSFSIGQMNQLGDALERSGFGAGDITVLGQGPFLPDLLGVCRGTHEIKPVACDWREENSVIYFSLVSNGWTGSEWESWYDANGYRLSDEARFLLRSSDFQPGQKGTKYEIAVLKGDLFSDAERTAQNIRAKGVSLGYKQNRDLNPEISCLIRQKFSNDNLKAMGLFRIVGMHETIAGFGGGPSLLGASRYGVDPWLNAYWGRPGDRWLRENGFAFLVPQVPPEAGRVASV